jgi:hypothetical protein
LYTGLCTINREYLAKMHRVFNRHIMKVNSLAAEKLCFRMREDADQLERFYLFPKVNSIVN